MTVANLNTNTMRKFNDFVEPHFFKYLEKFRIFEFIQSVCDGTDIENHLKFYLAMLFITE